MKELSPNQKQTEETFGFKWKKTETYESEHMQKEWRRWLFEKYFDNDSSVLEKILKGGSKNILDAGCGSGGSGFLMFGDYLKNHSYVGVDISDAVLIAEKRFKDKGISAKFVQSDLNSIPPELGQFDIIFSEGVLHHTDSVEQSLAQLSTRLLPGGLFMFYVYCKKAPVREYTDDLIRDAINPMSNEDAWEALVPLTELGAKLGDLNIEIEIEKDIDILEIPKGKYNLQRLFYYKIAKAYYRPEYSIEEMNHINFDWFRPKNCYRHTPNEIKLFCERANLKIQKMHLEDSGITVVASKV
jgi:arsenite methyltransferase